MITKVSCLPYFVASEISILPLKFNLSSERDPQLVLGSLIITYIIGES